VNGTAQPSDGELVAAAQAGDRGALDALLRRHYDRIHAVCSRIAGSTRDGDDAAQEAMISIVRGLPRFDGRAQFSTWVYRIATNAALDELRRRRRRPVVAAVDDEGRAAGVEDPLAERTVEASVDRLSIDAALADLPEDFRIAVVLRDVGDLDYAEIAETLGVPVGTVQSRLLYAIRTMRAVLEADARPVPVAAGGRP
jgi:RNA polymerase sigma-70 factor (ECF subfamily)